MNAWVFLILGIIFEVAATSALKLSNGFTQPVPSIFCAFGFILALFFLSQSVKAIDLAVVYAIWSGAGIALITLIAIFYYGENITLAKAFFISLIVVGVVGLQLTTNSQAKTETELSREP